MSDRQTLLRPARESRWFTAEIHEAAEAHELDPHLVEAIVLVESSGFAHAYRYEPAFWTRYLAGKPAWRHKNPRRVSASYGLMQVMYPTAVERGYVGDPEGLFTPRVGLTYGCLHLMWLLKWSKSNVDQALAAYNGGKYGNATAPYRNQDYVNKVRAKLAELQR